VDPKAFSDQGFVTRRGETCIIPPNSFVLCHTVEYFRIPRDVLVICLGKSTYARCGLIVNVTPLEPEWEGQVTIEISNTTPLPARIYANEGICQFLFLRARARRRSATPTAAANTWASAAWRSRSSRSKRHHFPMDRIRIRGGKPLHGAIPIGGAKNATLPLMAAGLLTDGPLTLENAPDLADIATMRHLLVQHGQTVEHDKEGRRLVISGTANNLEAPYDLVRKMRASVLVWARWSRASARRGCRCPAAAPSARGRSTCTSRASEQMGATFDLEGGYMHAKAPAASRARGSSSRR
jgi:hypothetical protein